MAKIRSVAMSLFQTDTDTILGFSKLLHRLHYNNNLQKVLIYNTKQLNYVQKRGILYGDIVQCTHSSQLINT